MRHPAPFRTFLQLAPLNALKIGTRRALRDLLEQGGDQYYQVDIDDFQAWADLVGMQPDELVTLS